MEAKTWVIIGFIGGIVAAVGVFLPWATASASAGGFTASVSASGWDATSGISAPYIALAGGILALLGGLAVLGGQKAIGYLMPIGGILAIAGGVWGFSDVNSALGAVSGVAGVSASVGYGVYACIAGGVLSLLGSLGLKKM
jgi:hypothetical protein